MKLTKTLLLVLVASFTLLMISCERPVTDIPTEHTTISGEIADGWAAYADADYAKALEHFITAALRNAAEIGAYNGLAWSYLHLGEYGAALSQFSFVKNLALEQNETDLLADSYAGVAFVHENMRFSGEFSGEEAEILNSHADASILSALEALNVASDYATTHDPDKDAAALNSLLANAYFYLHWYGNSLTRLVDGGDMTMEDLETADVSPYSVDLVLYPYMDEETGALTLEPTTIDWASSENYVDGSAVTGIISFGELTDANDSNAVAEVKVFDGTTVHFDASADYATITETIQTIQINYPLNNGAAIPITLLKLSKGGIFNIESIKIHTELYSDIYYPDGTTGVDTNIVPLDYDGPKEIFRFGDGFPVAINPTFGDDFKYNYVYLPNERNVGVTFDITYRYAYYTGTFTVTDNFTALLAKVSSYLD